MRENHICRDHPFRAEFGGARRVGLNNFGLSVGVTNLEAVRTTPGGLGELPGGAHTDCATRVTTPSEEPRRVTTLVGDLKSFMSGWTQ